MGRAGAWGDTFPPTALLVWRRRYAVCGQAHVVCVQYHYAEHQSVDAHGSD